jgi:glutathione S-transferase
MCTETGQKRGASGSGPRQGPPAKPQRIELYFFPECPYCRKVLTAIDDLGLRQRVVFHDARNDPKKKEALVELTGKTQVPCLVIDGKPMHESEDIKQYLHRTFGE